MIAEFAKYPVAQLFVQRPSLIARGLQECRDASLSDCVSLCRGHQLSCVAIAAPHLVNPQRSYVHPAAHNIPEDTAAHVVACVLDQKYHRIELDDAGRRRIVVAQRSLDRFDPRLRWIRFSYDAGIVHRTQRAHSGICSSEPVKSDYVPRVCWMASCSFSPRRPYCADA